MGNDVVDQGLGAAAVHQRFTHEDLVSIITNTATGQPPSTIGATGHTVTDPGRWLSQGTSAWSGFGTTAEANTSDDTDLEGATE
jgi:hypothetical protein